MTYRDELTRAMTTLGNHPDAVFLGQAVAYPGTAMTATLAGVPRDKLIELPVAEDMQMGMAIGLALAGYLPVCIYPRINFLLLAMNQLVLHLDKLPEFGNGWRPKVIIRTSIATPHPMDPGPQHLSDYTEPLRLMCRNIHVERIDETARVVPAYREAIDRESSLLIERAELYDHD